MSGLLDLTSDVGEKEEDEVLVEEEGVIEKEKEEERERARRRMRWVVEEIEEEGRDGGGCWGGNFLVSR